MGSGSTAYSSYSGSQFFQRTTTKYVYKCVISTQRRHWEKIYQQITTANWGLTTTNQPAFVLLCHVGCLGTQCEDYYDQYHISDLCHFQFHSFALFQYFSYYVLTLKCIHHYASIKTSLFTYRDDSEVTSVKIRVTSCAIWDRDMCQ